MPDVVLHFRGRKIRAAELAFLRQSIAENPGLSRHALSAQVCRAWNWVQPNGQLRDMVCRSLMLRLHRAGRELWVYPVDPRFRQKLLAR